MGGKKIKVYKLIENMKFGFVRVCLALLFLASCSLPGDPLALSTVEDMTEVQFNFSELLEYAERSQSAYDTVEEIEADYPDLVEVRLLEDLNLLYFLEKNQRQGYQTISVRGTANRLNILQDIEIALALDEVLGVPLHRGFQEDAIAIYQNSKPLLDRNLPVRVTGHSLGAAVAVILAGYLDADGYQVERIVTFGQPKYATEPFTMFSNDVFTRIAHGPDVVPMVPPFTSVHPYKHFEAELILKDGIEYSFISEHDVTRLNIGDLWRNLSRISLENHHIESYVENIQFKIENGAMQVPLRQTILGRNNNDAK